jgi:hypothetical protein
LQVFAYEQFRLQQPRNRARIVQWCAFDPVFLGIVSLEKTQHARGRVCHGIAEFADPAHAGSRRQNLVRDIQAHRNNRTPTVENNIRCMRIDKNIELRRGRVIAAFPHRATHDDQLLDLRQDVGCAIQDSTDVRQRAGRHKCDGSIFGRAQRVDDKIDGVLFLQWRLRVDDLNAVDTGVAMHFFRCQQLTYHRPVAARMHRNIAAPGDITHLAHIALRQIQRNVAGNSSYTKYVECVRRGHREEQRDRVVLSRIAINDDLALRHCPSSLLKK